MRKVLVLTALVVLAPIPATATATDPVGFWSAGEGRSQIEIAPCGEMLCGKIVWLWDVDRFDDARLPVVSSDDHPAELQLRKTNRF